MYDEFVMYDEFEFMYSVTSNKCVSFPSFRGFVSLSYSCEIIITLRNMVNIEMMSIKNSMFIW